MDETKETTEAFNDSLYDNEEMYPNKSKEKP